MIRFFLTSLSTTFVSDRESTVLVRIDSAVIGLRP
jgi:hypothetical protein